MKNYFTSLLIFANNNNFIDDNEFRQCRIVEKQRSRGLLILFYIFFYRITTSTMIIATRWVGKICGKSVVLYRNPLLWCNFHLRDWIELTFKLARQTFPGKECKSFDGFPKQCRSQLASYQKKIKIHINKSHEERF